MNNWNERVQCKKPSCPVKLLSPFSVCSSFLWFSLGLIPSFPCLEYKEPAWVLWGTAGAQRPVVPISLCGLAEAIQCWRSSDRRFYLEFKQKVLSVVLGHSVGPRFSMLLGFSLFLVLELCV